MHFSPHREQRQPIDAEEREPKDDREVGSVDPSVVAERQRPGQYRHQNPAVTECRDLDEVRETAAQPGIMRDEVEN